MGGDSGIGVGLWGRWPMVAVGVVATVDIGGWRLCR